MSEYIHRIKKLKEEYNLDNLEVSGGYFLIECRKGLDAEDFNKLGKAIKELQEGGK